MTLTTSYWPADTSEPVLEATVGEILRDAAATVPDRIALVAGGPGPAPRRRWTYAEMLAQSEAVAHALLARFQPGERVAVWAPNLPEWVLLEFGAALAGVVLVTVNPAYRAKELAYVLRQSRASGIFLVDEFRGNPMAASLAEVHADLPDLGHVVRFAEWDDFMDGGAAGDLPMVRPEDPAQIQYTSGTTGFPKGALLHHRGIVNNARLTALRFEVGDGDVWLNPMPLFHTGGCVLAALGTVWGRATHIPLLAFDPGLVLELIETERIDLMGGVPTMLIAMMEHPDFATRDLSSLRAVLSGGSTVPAELVRRIEAGVGVRFGIVFGQTEASPVITQTCLDDTPEDKAETIGRPQPQQDVKIVDPESGQTVPVDAIGEICARGYNVMLGYFDMPEATAETVDADGWLHTGDLATMDERGYCRIVGRLKDMIIRGGENIYPREVEELLFTHPAVADVAVLGIPDPLMGEEVACVVRLAPGHDHVTAIDLRSFVRERLAPQKAPRRWAFVDEFPQTPSGKIQKFVLRDRFVAGDL
ncbi:MAG: fatty-acyl-CoA synthase [Acidimicrobiaceae bacterium]|nr:fatty-acyl-CoA synthase [Acidimicrobiaceae bacterium]